MTPIFCNREFQHPADGWYEFESKGEHLNREAGVSEVIDDVAADSITNAFNELADDPNFPGMLIDTDHFKHQMDQKTLANGWLMRTQNRADGIYGQIRWTATGHAAVDGGDYRYFSTEYDPEDLVNLGGDPPRVRPMRLAGLTLTNMPNNKGGKPITNRGGDESAATVTSAGACRAFGLIVNRKRATLKCSFDHAWNMASKEEPALFAAMHNRQRRTDAAPAVERAPRLGPVVANRIAREMILNIVRTEQAQQGGDFDRHWHRVCNRRPGLVRIMNSADDAGWLAGLEATAHAEYMQAVQGDAQAYAGANPDSRKFFEGIGALANEFPELGFEGRWEKLKELYRKLFWQFVLDAGSKSEEAP